MINRPITMDFSKRDLDLIPEECWSKKRTNWLILSNNNIVAVPESIKGATSLTRLALNDNKIEVIDPAIGYLRNISWLDLTRNNLRSLPKELSNLTNITGLGLSENCLEELPECIYSLYNLRKFGCFANQIKYIGPNIKNLVSLCKLDLSNNFIERLPDEICELKSLTWFNLTNNRLKELPQNLRKLSNLIELGLGNNQLTSLPSLDGMKKLKILPVFKNKIKEIGDVSSLISLQKLDLSDNKLEEFPMEILYLKELRYLNLKSNDIKELNFDVIFPPVISNLTMLDISSNKLEYIPMRFFKTFANVVQIRIKHNNYKLRNKTAPEDAPGLLGMCYTNMINNSPNLISNLARKIFTNPCTICDICDRLFVTSGYYTYNVSLLSDDTRFISRKVLCSYKCFSKDNHNRSR